MPLDLTKSVVRIADREWPISLDLATGGLLLHLSVRRYLLKPLTWGAKRKLARFAHLGGEFLRRHLALACATPAEWPVDDAEAEALMLAASVVSACDADAFPFSAGALLRVSLEVARETGTTLDALDEQAAADVEALWRMMAEISSQPRANQERRLGSPIAPEAPTEPPPDPGWNRIVVLPDPAPIAGKEPASDAATMPAPLMPEAEFVENGALSEIASAEAVSAGTAVSPASTEPSFPAPQPPQTTSASNDARPARAPDHTIALPKRDEKRFRVTWSAVPATLPSVRSEQVGEESKSESDPRGCEAPADDSWIAAHGSASPHFRPVPIGEPSASAKASSPAFVEAETARAPSPPSHLHDPRLSIVPSHEPLLPRRMPIAASESLIEGFADELESAAVAAGIELEG